MKKVVLGLSGGVDSAVTAALLVEQGYQVAGVFLECWRAPGCRVDEDRRDALDVARMLGIDFQVLDLKQAYKEKVVDYFYQEYAAGRTPNPDTMCNREIKFGMFYDWAMENGFDYVATGHYARNDTKRLMRGKDEKKDQSYFLYQLREEQLGHILFPIGEMTKVEVRNKAKELGLPVAKKPDSQGICFIGEVSVKDFLMELGMKSKQGLVCLKLKATTQNLIVWMEDLVEIGVQDGAWFYTIGQRHGFTIHDLRFKNENQRELFEQEYDLSNMPPLYVIEKDVDKNVLVVGTRDMLMQDEFEVEEIQWISSGYRLLVTGDRKIQVRIRHGGSLTRAVVSSQDSVVRVKLDEAVFGVAPGQVCVLYKDDVVLGGGVIVG